MFSALRAWLALADYDAAREAATNEIIARFSRRNVSVQNGWSIDSDEIKVLSELGDRAIDRISKAINAHADLGRTS